MGDEFTIPYLVQQPLFQVGENLFSHLLVQQQSLPPIIHHDQQLLPGEQSDYKGEKKWPDTKWGDRYSALRLAQW